MPHALTNPEGHLQYLLLTDGGVFSLALQRERSDLGLCRSRWVLNYRIEDSPAQDRDRTAFSVNVGKEGLFSKRGLSSLALVPLLLANVAHYHGHLCPELAYWLPGCTDCPGGVGPIAGKRPPVFYCGRKHELGH